MTSTAATTLVYRRKRTHGRSPDVRSSEYALFFFVFLRHSISFYRSIYYHVSLKNVISVGAYDSRSILFTVIVVRVYPFPNETSYTLQDYKNARFLIDFSSLFAYNIS